MSFFLRTSIATSSFLFCSLTASSFIEKGSLKEEGMHYTIINGQVLTKDGDHTGSYPGQLLRSAGAQ